jgi:hypothetical protein
MVRHYIPKHKAWQRNLWETSLSPRGVYIPEFKEKYREAKEPEVITDITDSYGETKTCDSHEEWRVNQALHYLSLPFYYQYSIAGGRKLAGGQVIDFYVETVPTPSLVYVQGTYWHTGSKGSERLLNLSEAESYFSYKVRGIENWDYEIKDT